MHPWQEGCITLERHLKTLPSSPGVYRMVGKQGTILYIGKAKNLKKRVAQYLKVETLPYRLQRMVSEIHSLEIIVTHTELEALLLESNLIKELDPQYNILLKDDKGFPLVELTSGPYPRPLLYRGKPKTGGEYYGPFASTDAVYKTLEALHKTLQLRSCTDVYFGARKRPCLQYHIKRCSAPCVGKITMEEYQESVRQARLMLTGKNHSIQRELARRMQAASAALEYEKAADLRNRIRALSFIQTRQHVHVTGLKDTDVIAAVQKGGCTCIEVFFYRNGSHYGNYTSFPQHAPEEALEDVLYSFLNLFYVNHPVPPQLIVSHRIPQQELVAQALAARHRTALHILTPKVGPKYYVLKNALENATIALDRYLQRKLSTCKLLQEVQEMFELGKFPHRIEVYDNSHIQGSCAYGAMIVSTPEGFDKKSYRLFTIKDPDVFKDDFGMMQEVMHRRFRNAQDLDVKQNWPDLILIDGGKGQLSSVARVLEELNLATIPVVAISKGPQRNAGREFFHSLNRPSFQLPIDSPLLHYLQSLRDEAHRFAIGHHRKRRTKKMVRSFLDEIPGIGAKRRKQLLHHFGSVRGIELSGLHDLEKVPGISKTLAAIIYKAFHPGSA